MNQLSRLAAAAVLASSAMFVTSVSALTVNVDAFGLPIPGVVIADNNGVADALVTANPSAASSSRTLTHRLLTPGAFGQNGNGNLSSAGTGALPNFVANQLNMSNGNGVDSEVTATWTMNAIAGASFPASFVFDVITSDPGVTGFQNTVEGFFNGVSLGTKNLTVGLGFFDLNAAQAGMLGGAGQTFSLVFNGANAWDAAIDNLRLEIPEPTSLALVGLALIGAGAVARRTRKA